MTHDPKAVEVLARMLTDDLEVRREDAAWYAQRALDALTAADLSIVGEGELERYKAALFLACRDGWDAEDESEGAVGHYLAKADAWLSDQGDET